MNEYKKYKDCPRCGQGQIPFRYDKCPNCGLLSEQFIKKSESHKGPSWNMSMKEFTGLD